MDIYRDFDFIEKKQAQKDLTIGDILIKKEDISLVLSAIEDVIHWIPTSLYSSCFTGVYLTLSDCPGEALEFVDIDPYSERVYIHLNVLSLIADYHYRPLYREIIFKELAHLVDLSTYVQFFFLHELGHIVDACLNTPNHRNLLDKFEANVLKFLPFYSALDRKFALDKGKPLDEKIQAKLESKYRHIPSEKWADTFAFSVLRTWEKKNPYNYL